MKDKPHQFGYINNDPRSTDASSAALVTDRVAININIFFLHQLRIPLMCEGLKNNVGRMYGPKKIIILILSIHLFLVHSDEQSNKDLTKLINYGKIHLNRLSETQVNDHIKNHELHHEELEQLEYKLHLLQNNLTELASLPLDKEVDIAASNAKSVVLNSEFDHLNKELDKYRICRNLPLLYDIKKVDELLEVYSYLVVEKAEMYKNIEDKVQTQLVDDCIRAIEMKRFWKATEKFSLLKDDDKINDIINRTYSEDNASYLLNVGNSIKNLRRAYLLYKALYNKLYNDKEQIRYEYWYFVKSLELLKSIKRELLDQPSIDSYLKYNAGQLVKAVKSDFVNLGVKILTKDVFVNSTLNILKDIFVLDYEVVGEICYQTTVETHKERLNDLKHKLNLVFTKLSETNEGNDLHFGQFIKYLETKWKGSEYERSLQSVLVGMKEKLPKIVKNILYSEKVCIKQNGIDRYLKEARRVRFFPKISYSVRIGDQESKQEERWQLIHVQGDEYIIKNLLHNYSLVAEVTKLHKQGEKIRKYREVITANKKRQRNIWKIEVINDYAYIKNTANNEYLFATFEITRDDAATNNINGKLSKRYQWNILDCTNVPLREGPS